jgi:hypothetical protein
VWVFVASLALGVDLGGDDAPGRVAHAGDAEPSKLPPNSVLLPLTGKQTVRAGANTYIIDGPQVIPGGSAIRLEKQVNVQGINHASLDVQGELAVHGTEDFWVHIRDVDFSPTKKPDGGLHFDMASLHQCTFKHGEGAAFEGGITFENSALQGDCEFDVRLASGFLRIMTVEFFCPCKVAAVATKTKAVEFAIRTCWMKDVTFSGAAAATIRDAEVKGALSVMDVTDFVLDGTDCFGDVSIRQGAGSSFAKVVLQKCNLFGGSKLKLERPTGDGVKNERVQLQRWFFESEQGKGLSADKDVAARIDDGVDDPAQSIRAFWSAPNGRKHEFLSPSLRKRAPPSGG